MFSRSKLLALALGGLLPGLAQADSALKTFTLTNTGDGALTVSSAAITGNSTEFALTGNTCSTLAPGAHCELSVTFTPSDGGPRPSASLQFTSNGSNGPTHSISLAGKGKSEQIVSLSSVTVDVNMASLFGNPTEPGRYTLIINPGAIVASSSPSVAALTTGTFPVGSTVKLVNQGTVIGKGGRGGAGGNLAYSATNGVVCYTQTAAAEPGQAGGTAMSLQYPVSIDNTVGFIFGGGGGGGGGAGAGFQFDCGAGGGGGGGGAGGATGGAGGTTTGFQSPQYCELAWSAADGWFVGLNTWGDTANRVGNSGVATNLSGGGGLGGAATPIATGSPSEDAITGGGGSGGGFGAAGQSGSTAQLFVSKLDLCVQVQGAKAITQPGAPGGAAGAAVLTNGNSVTWLGGADSSHVTGFVR